MFFSPGGWKDFRGNWLQLSISCLVIAILERVTFLLVSNISLIPHYLHMSNVLLERTKCRRQLVARCLQKRPPRFGILSMWIPFGQYAENTNLASRTINTLDSSPSSGNFRRL